MNARNTIEEINKVIKAFVLEQYMFGYNEDELGNDSSLLELGVLDSTGIIEMVAFIEHRFKIPVLDEEITPENFDSINYISSFVNKKNKIIEEY
jgi:acyl carrier protein